MSTLSTRPELACEIVPEGVLAARRQPDSGLLAQVAFASFGPNAPMAAFAPYVDRDAPRVGMPGLATGDPNQRAAVVQAMQRALENIGARSGVLTLVVPDQAVRVLLMDFDSLPHKAADAIPLLRFRLKKMLPFDVDEAHVSYQALPSKTGAKAIVAVMPNVVLAEYEAMVRDAGFEPGIVMPSTLACLGMVPEGDTALIVHASTQCVTTAIATGSELLLHRTQELPWTERELAQTMNPTAVETDNLQTVYAPAPELTHELVFEDTASNAELAAQISDATVTMLYPVSASYEAPQDIPEAPQDIPEAPQQNAEAATIEWQPLAEGSPDAVPQPEELPASLVFEHEVPVSIDDLLAAGPQDPDAVETELQHAFAIAAAYFEDSLGHAPSPIYIAGTLDARTWRGLLADYGERSLDLRELVTMEDMGTASVTGIHRAQLGAVCGALRG